MPPVQYVTGSEAKDLEITWLANGVVRDLSTGYSFTVRIARQGGDPALIQKTSGITGSATAPNVVVSWTAGELDALAVGVYQLDVIARVNATNKDLIDTTILHVLSGVAAPA